MCPPGGESDKQNGAGFTNKSKFPATVYSSANRGGSNLKVSDASTSPERFSNGRYELIVVFLRFKVAK